MDSLRYRCHDRKNQQPIRTLKMYLQIIPKTPLETFSTDLLYRYRNAERYLDQKGKSAIQDELEYHIRTRAKIFDPDLICENTTENVIRSILMEVTHNKNLTFIPDELIIQKLAEYRKWFDGKKLDEFLDFKLFFQSFLGSGELENFFKKNVVKGGTTKSCIRFLIDGNTSHLCDILEVISDVSLLVFQRGKDDPVKFIESLKDQRDKQLVLDLVFYAANMHFRDKDDFKESLLNDIGYFESRISNHLSSKEKDRLVDNTGTVTPLTGYIATPLRSG